MWSAIGWGSVIVATYLTKEIVRLQSEPQPFQAEARPTWYPSQVTSMSRLPVFLAVLCAPLSLIAQNNHPTPPPEVRAVPLQGVFRLDGRLDEPIWQTAPVATDFLQNQPQQGERATQRTEVRFAFDAAALYVGARMFDDSGARGIRTQLVRRDADFSSDYIQVIFDTYHDHIGRLFFL